MTYNLFINYYIDANADRQAVIDFCITENLKNTSIDRIVLVASADLASVIGDKYWEYSAKLFPVYLEGRPTYNTFFALTRKLSSGTDINIICNSDIIIPADTLQNMQNYFQHENTCLALSRWDVAQKDSYTDNAVLFDRADSQDTWIFKGGIGQIEGADFTMGIAGCDNAIAYLINAAGYTLSNPCRSLKTYHLHLSNIRNYIQGENIQRIPPPYQLIAPI